MTDRTKAIVVGVGPEAGLGGALCKRLSREGYHVFVAGRTPDKVEAVKAKAAMLGWFVGQVMKSTGGKANPQAVNELLKKKLGV